MSNETNDLNESFNIMNKVLETKETEIANNTAKNNKLIGKTVIVYDRYHFAVPLRGWIEDVSEKDGAYQVSFYSNQHGYPNYLKWDHTFFLSQQCHIVPDKKIKIDPKHTASEIMRTFDTGATRNNDPSRLDYEGFLSPLVLKRYAEYMNKNRVQADGVIRDSDNWQKGIPIEQYMKSKLRHIITTWIYHRKELNEIVTSYYHEEIVKSLCAELFNTMGMLHELLKYEEEKN